MGCIVAHVASSLVQAYRVTDQLGKLCLVLMSVIEKQLKKAEQEEDDKEDEAILVDKGKFHIFLDYLRAIIFISCNILLSLQVKMHLSLQIYQSSRFLYRLQILLVFIRLQIFIRLNPSKVTTRV